MEGSGTNPRGGGGNQWMEPYVVTQGEYGYHRTMVGKIVYRKPRHRFSPRDLERIMPKAAAEAEKKEEFLWWQVVINKIVDWIIGKITPFEWASPLFTAAWGFSMETWMRVVEKIAGGNTFTTNTIRLYGDMYKDALKEFVESGETAALDKLYERLTGGN